MVVEPMDGYQAEEWKVFEITRQIDPKSTFPFDGQVYVLRSASVFTFCVISHAPNAQTAIGTMHTMKR